MATQLLPEAVGLAVGVLIFSFVCLAFGLLTGFLVWVHRDRTSYVFLLAIFTSLGTLASIAQQLHTIVRWRDIKLEQFQHSVANAGNPELAVAGPSTGLDLGLFYIQFVCYNIEALIIFFWCAALLQSIFQLRSFRDAPRYVGLLVKFTAIVIPIIMITVLQADTVQHNRIAFFLIANSCMAVGLTGGALMLIAILIRYIYTRRQLLSWNVGYGDPSGQLSNPNMSSVMASVHAPRKSIYDRWLLLRFTIGFIGLGTFQFVTIMFEIASAGQNHSDNVPGSADLSLARVKTDFILFLPGVLPPLLTFIVFGTTKPFRDYVWVTFVPRLLRRRKSASDHASVAGETRLADQESQEMHTYVSSRSWRNGLESNKGIAREPRIDAESDEESILRKSGRDGV